MMATERKKREIKDLINHLKKHKDAVLIIGEKIAPELNIKNIGDIEGQNVFNRKSWTKSPKDFWNYYLNNIYFNLNEAANIPLPSIYKKIDELLSLNIIKKVYSVNTHGLCKKAINIKGTGEGFKCSRCGELHTKEELEEYRNNSLEKSIDLTLEKILHIIPCKNCSSKKIRPTCLMYGENYMYEEMKDLLSEVFLDKEDKTTLPNTHTIIYLGVDMEEDFIGELYDNYVLIREKEEEECFNVMITDSGNTVALFEPEFATSQDIEDSLDRLITLLNN